MKDQKASEKHAEKECAGAYGKKTVFCLGTIFLLLMPVLGYLTERLLGDGLRFPTGEELLYFPLNAGVYAAKGFFALGTIALVIGTIVMFVRGGFNLSALIASVIFYAMVVTVFVGIIEWMTGIFNADFHFVLFGIEIDGSRPIPGAGETLGVALVYTVFYNLLLAVFFIGARSKPKRNEKN